MSVAEDRARIERLCEQTFGPDWRKLAIVSPLGVIRLADLPDEAGPAPLEPPQAQGIWQTLPPRPLVMHKGPAGGATLRSAMAAMAAYKGHRGRR